MDARAEANAQGLILDGDSFQKLSLTLARMLPAQYRGVYAERAAAPSSAADERPPR